MRRESARYTTVAAALSLLALALPPAATAETPRAQRSTERPRPPANEIPADQAGAPLVVDAPGEVEISIKIVPTADTRELRIYADSESYYRSTTIGLHGIDSDPVHTVRWRGFPAGEYDVVGMLVDNRGSSEVVVRGALRVIGD